MDSWTGRRRRFQSSVERRRREYRKRLSNTAHMASTRSAIGDHAQIGQKPGILRTVLFFAPMVGLASIRWRKLGLFPRTGHPSPTLEKNARSNQVMLETVLPAISGGLDDDSNGVISLGWTNPLFNLDTLVGSAVEIESFSDES
jgi:hypothetical protein